MTYLQVSNVKISGITTCVPSRIEDNRELSGFSESEAYRIIESTGIREKRVVDEGVTPSDLCVKAAEYLIKGLQWDREDIDCLIFVSTNRDYLQPTTSCVIHDRLKLKESCYVLDVPCGCPGWIYGLNVMGTFLQTGQLKKGLLLVGDTSTKMNYSFDKSTRPLFGDAGSATAMEFCECSPVMSFSFSTVSSGWREIITLDGGARNPFSKESLIPKDMGDGYCLRPVDCSMNGMNVFAFSLSTPPKVVNELLSHFSVDINNIDYFLCHQANKYIVDKIRKKVGVRSDIVPLSLDTFGNTSNASIPLTIVSRCKDDFKYKKLNVLAVAFGTGLMCGAVNLQTECIFNDLIEY